jgi:hypothetical protein
MSRSVVVILIWFAFSGLGRPPAVVVVAVSPMATPTSALASTPLSALSVPFSATPTPGSIVTARASMPAPATSPDIGPRIATLEDRVRDLQLRVDSNGGLEWMRLGITVIATFITALTAAFLGSLASFVVGERNARGSTLRDRIDKYQQDLVAVQAAEQELERNVRMAQRGDLRLGEVWVPLRREALDSLSTVNSISGSGRMPQVLVETHRVIDHYNTLVALSNSLTTARRSPGAAQWSDPVSRLITAAQHILRTFINSPGAAAEETETGWLPVQGVREAIDDQLRRLEIEIRQVLPTAALALHRRSGEVELRLETLRSEPADRPAGVRWWRWRWQRLLTPGGDNTYDAAMEVALRQAHEAARQAKAEKRVIIMERLRARAQVTSEKYQNQIDQQDTHGGA